MTSKSRFTLAAMAVMVALAFTMNVQAQAPTTPPPPPQQTAAGDAWAGINNQKGSLDTAYSQNTGGGGAGFSALDPALASGDATAAITGTGKEHIGTNKGLSTATTNLVVTTTANGQGPNIVSLLGDAEQANGVKIGDANNGASGWSLTDGGFTGTATAPGSLLGTGIAAADGTTKVVSKGAGTNDASGSLLLKADSTGSTLLTGTPPSSTNVTSNVSGQGAGGVQSLVGPTANPNALSTGVGSGSYVGSGAPGGEQGSLLINIKTSAVQSKNVTSACSAVQVTSSVTPTPQPVTPPPVSCSSCSGGH